jgi:hypothetical protein
MYSAPIIAALPCSSVRSSSVIASLAQVWHSVVGHASSVLSMFYCQRWSPQY